MPAALLVVGPESAGGDPGPACYGRGTQQPTVTDANMVSGFLNPQSLAGGSLPVDAALVAAVRWRSMSRARSGFGRGCGARHPSGRQRQHGPRDPRCDDRARQGPARSGADGFRRWRAAACGRCRAAPRHSPGADKPGFRRVLRGGMLAAEAVHEFVRPLLAPLCRTGRDGARRARRYGRRGPRSARRRRIRHQRRAISLFGRCSLPWPVLAIDGADAARALTSAALHQAFEKFYLDTFGYAAKASRSNLSTCAFRRLARRQPG